MEEEQRPAAETLEQAGQPPAGADKVPAAAADELTTAVEGPAAASLAGGDAAAPAAPAAPHSAAELEGDEDEAQRQEDARTAQLLTRPFSEQMAFVLSTMPLKPRAAEANRHLARLLDSHPALVAAQPGLLPLLGACVAEGPGLPAAGGAMAVLARLCLEPDGRAKVRAECPLAPVVRYLALADPEHSKNAEPAALLVMNAAADKLTKRALLAAGAVQALVALLPKVPSHKSPLGWYAAGALLALADTQDSGGRGAQCFVDGGGIEAVCQVLGSRPRGDTGRGSLRLRVLLSQLCRAHKGWETRIHQAAMDAGAPGGAPVA